jgi:hypothetical protein
MKRIFYALTTFVAAALLVGCGGSSPNTSDVYTTEKFQFNGVNNFEFFQPYNATNVIYHTPDELKDMLNGKIIDLLNKKELLSNDTTMDVIKLDVEYARGFVGDASPVKTDSLRPPSCSYKLYIINKDNQTIQTIERNNLTFNGGFLMNLQTIAGGLRDKKYELEFIEAFANTIVNSIEDL